MLPDPAGLYLFAPDAQKEIDRLRALVRAAYIEGAAADARAEIEAAVILGILWDNSRAKKEMK